MNWTKQDITRIYNALADAESKYIFGNRFLFSLTENKEYMENVIKTTVEGKKFYERLEQTNTKKVILQDSIMNTDLTALWIIMLFGHMKKRKDFS